MDFHEIIAVYGIIAMDRGACGAEGAGMGMDASWLGEKCISARRRKTSPGGLDNCGVTKV